MNIAALEVPLLPNLMKDKQAVENVIGRKIEHVNNINHQSESYVDDNTNMVGADSIEDLAKYTQNFYDLLKEHYKQNKLKLNESKTTFVLMKTESQNAKYNRMKLKIHDDKSIEDDKAVKVLGW